MDSIKLATPEKRKLEFPLTPMLDVMFILLTVFIAISEARQSVHDLKLPEIDENDSQPAVQEQDIVTVLVQIKEDASRFVDGEPISEEEFETLLREQQAAHGDLLRVHLEAEEATAYGEILDVLLKLKGAGVQDVSLAYRTRTSNASED